MKVAVIPQIDGLTTEDFEQFAKSKPLFLKWLLPNERDWNHIDKKWMCDVLYTKDAAGFQDMVMKAIVERKKKIEQS